MAKNTDQELAQSILYHAALSLKSRIEKALMQEKHFNIKPDLPPAEVLEFHRMVLLGTVLGLDVGNTTVAVAQEINALTRSKPYTEWLPGLKAIAKAHNLNYEDTYV